MTDLLTCPHCERVIATSWRLPDEYKGIRFAGYGINHKAGRRRVPGQAMGLLKVLVEANGEIVPYASIERVLWGYSPDRESPTRNHIAVIRVKLNEALHGSGLYVETLRGQGYRIAETG